MTLEDWRQLAATRNTEKMQLREEVAELRSQVLQLNKIATFLDDFYYVPMTKPWYRRVWFALRIKSYMKRLGKRSEPPTNPNPNSTN